MRVYSISGTHRPHQGYTCSGEAGDQLNTTVSLGGCLSRGQQLPRSLFTVSRHSRTAAQLQLLAVVSRRKSHFTQSQPKAKLLTCVAIARHTVRQPSYSRATQTRS